MAEGKKKLRHRVNRIMGQMGAIQRAMEKDVPCSELLHAISACRGAMDALMAAVIEDHIESQVLPPDGTASKRQAKAAEDLVKALRVYLK